MKDQERDLLRKTILELLMKDRVCWTDLKKKVLGSCQPFATDSTFCRELDYLLKIGCIQKMGEKGTRAQYMITERGRQLLRFLSVNF